MFVLTLRISAILYIPNNCVEDVLCYFVLFCCDEFSLDSWSGTHSLPTSVSYVACEGVWSRPSPLYV